MIGCGFEQPCFCFMKSTDSSVGKFCEDPPPDGYSASTTGATHGVLPTTVVYSAGWLSTPGLTGFIKINKTLFWLLSFICSITEQFKFENIHT